MDLKPNTIYLLVAIGFFLQNMNAGLSGVIHSPVVSVLLSSSVGAFQVYMAHLGIKTDPGEVKK